MRTHKKIKKYANLTLERIELFQFFKKLVLCDFLVRLMRSVTLILILVILCNKKFIGTFILKGIEQKNT